MTNIKFKQLIVYVNDMANMVDFYHAKLGLEIAFPQVDDYGGQSYVAFNTGSSTFALHTGKESKETPQDAPKYNFEVKDIEGKRADLISKGVEMSQIINATPTKLISSGRDPEGNGFFLEMKKE